MRMENNTLEDYKIAVKAKYEIEKRGSHSSVFINPSRAKLRGLCLEIFKSNRDQNDLNVFSSFFRFDFSSTSSGKLKGQTDKFRPIETFFRGKTNPADVEAVNLAAILVDFQPRPFLKFSKTDWKKDSAKTEEFLMVNEKNEEIDTHKFTPKSLKNTFLEKMSKKMVLGVAVILSLGCTYYFAFKKEQCMQWSDNHYEIVNCVISANDSLKSLVEPFDKGLFDLKKIQVCDTTTFFKNGKAVIWYAKTNDGIDFFNTHGRHPENDNALKPVTRYIINKYVIKP